MYQLIQVERPDPYGFKIALNNSPHSGGVEFTRWLGGCGTGFMKNFSYAPHNVPYKTMATLIATAYKELFYPGHTLYTLSDSNLNSQLHTALLLIGAEKLAEWPNLYHGPSKIHLFKVNLRDAVGVYCNEYGEPYEVMPEVIPPRKEHVAPKSMGDFHSPFAELPKRNPNEQPTAHPAV